MQNRGFRLSAPKFRSRDHDNLYQRLLAQKDLYLARNSSKTKRLLIYKSLLFITMSAAGYAGIYLSTGLPLLLFSYLCFGGGLVLLGVNLGHDAAHGCATGNRQLDRRIFRLIFGIQGLNGYLWEIRHNHSHHPFPNVYGYDCDLETSRLFHLNKNVRKRWFHRYQHLYAPIVYSVFSLVSVFYLDLKIFYSKKLGNISFRPSAKDAISLWLFKLIHLAVYAGFPVIFAKTAPGQIILSYLIMHLFLSVVISFVFFISHHVEETSYSETTDNEVQHSWIETQVHATLDFYPESRLAGFFFGGFNAHLAHHLFPSVSHVHYPGLTAIIRQELGGTNLRYNTLSFRGAVRSHLRLLRKMAR